MIVEERDYKVRHGKLAEFTGLYSRHGLPIQEEHLGKFLGYFTTEIGELNHASRGGSTTASPTARRGASAWRRTRAGASTSR